MIKTPSTFLACFLQVGNMRWCIKNDKYQICMDRGPSLSIQQPSTSQSVKKRERHKYLENIFGVCSIRNGLKISFFFILPYSTGDQPADEFSSSASVPDQYLILLILHIKYYLHTINTIKSKYYLSRCQNVLLLEDEMLHSCSLLQE